MEHERRVGCMYGTCGCVCSIAQLRRASPARRAGARTSTEAVAGAQGLVNRIGTYKTKYFEFTHVRVKTRQPGVAVSKPVPVRAPGRHCCLDSRHGHSTNASISVPLRAPLPHPVRATSWGCAECPDGRRLYVTHSMRRQRRQHMLCVRVLSFTVPLMPS